MIKILFALIVIVIIADILIYYYLYGKTKEDNTAVKDAIDRILEHDKEIERQVLEMREHHHKRLKELEKRQNFLQASHEDAYEELSSKVKELEKQCAPKKQVKKR